jgi:hypothetical protein
MKFCQTHWGKLRDAIDARGLTPLISIGGKSAAEKMISACTEGPSLDNFDPLLGAHNKIVEHAMSAGGLAVILQEGCPLCFLKEQHELHCTIPNCTQDFEKWIDYAADGAKEYVENEMAGKGKN